MKHYFEKKGVYRVIKMGVTSSIQIIIIGGPLFFGLLVIITIVRGFFKQTWLLSSGWSLD